MKYRYTAIEAEAIKQAVGELVYMVHEIWAKPKGWWTDIETGEPKERNIGELIALCHSELSEALEGHRKSRQDDHLPQYTSLEVELADCLIRIFDMAGGLNFKMAETFLAKMEYNHSREDHMIENRKKDGGKKY